MDVDTITITLKSVVTKLKDGLKESINTWKQYDSETDKVAKNLNKIVASNKSTDNSFKDSKQRIQEISAEYKRLSSIIKKYSPEMGFRSDFAQYTKYSTDTLKSARAGSIKERDALISKDRSDADESRLSTLGKDITDVTQAMRFLKETGGQSYDEIVSKAQEYKRQLDEINAKQRELSNAKLPNVENTGKQYVKLNSDVKNTTNSVNRLSSSMRGLNRSTRGIGINGFDFIRDKFKDFTKNFGKNIDNNVRQIKKFTLGLIGVRTAMSVLTKAVGSYLSFDSELQNSLTNSWNMLGSLLAPAIELVANLFAMATNYVAQFVNALTGINLVARANAKALQSQAKSTKGVSDAQRGLLSMDEITNLPTEPGGGGGGGDVNQIKMDPIDTNGIFKEFLDAFKKHKWHRAGEIIAEGINSVLGKINWDDIRAKAEATGVNIASFLNGVFEVKWGLIGSTFANGLNTLVDLLHGFFTTLEWGRLGAGLGTAINGFFANFDFKKTAETITAGIVGLLDTVSAFIVTLDEEKIVNSVIDFVETIDWLRIGNEIIDLLVHGIRLALSTKDALWTRVVNDIKNMVFPKIDKLGADIGGTLGKNIAKFLKESLKTAFTGFKIDIPIGDYKVSTKLFKFLPLATGTNEIQTEGVYHLHEGEAVVPKKYNPATGGYNNGSDNRQIIDLLISLNSSMLEYANRPINIDMNGRKVAEGIYDDMQQLDKNRNKSTVMTRS